MGMFAFKRAQAQREAAANAAASAPVKPAQPETTSEKPDGNLTKRNTGKRKRQQLPDAE